MVIHLSSLAVEDCCLLIFFLTSIDLMHVCRLPGSTPEAQFAFASSWVENHIHDCNSVLKKPLVVAEFAKSSRSSGYNVTVRDNYFNWMYNNIYTSARGGGSGVGAMFWQLMAQGMQSYGDGYEVILAESPSTAKVIASQSRRLSTKS